MLFQINPKSGTLERVQSDWSPKELELERYLVTRVDVNIPVMAESVFGEPLLLMSNQVRTNARKRADMLALDRAGNGVVIELKRNAGQLGIETQALHYLADFANYRGANFVRRFAANVSEETILSFVGDKATVDKINLRSRVILVARSFDESVFSLGEWLCSKGVAFRCISYSPVQIGETQMLSFSVAFDRSPDALYPLAFGSVAREPGVFWHNIARAEQRWWDFLVRSREIPACFENSPGDQGERVLAKYVAGDKIVAYAKGFGAIGWGVIDAPQSYRLIPKGDKDDLLDGDCRHRLGISWKAVATTLRGGLAAEDIRREFSIYHPISTSVSMNTSNGEKLVVRLSEMFGAHLGQPQRKG